MSFDKCTEQRLQGGENPLVCLHAPLPQLPAHFLYCYCSTVCCWHSHSTQLDLQFLQPIPSFRMQERAKITCQPFFFLFCRKIPRSCHFTTLPIMLCQPECSVMSECKGNCEVESLPSFSIRNSAAVNNFIIGCLVE